MAGLANFLRSFRRRCKKRGICAHCFSRPAIKGLTRCRHCKRKEAEGQRARLRRNYLRDEAAGKCVRCHKNPQQKTNKRCRACEIYHQAHKKRVHYDAA